MLASSKPATNWSSCSIEQFNQGFKAGLDICLYDVPETIFEPTVSTCGNGIIENGEQCDCGRTPIAECNPKCCNSTTCQLTESASCASGRCCDISRCQILATGRLCRISVNDCDLPEYCGGDLSTCSADTYRPDGTNCTINGDFANCYSGNCRSHQSQCELIWGKGTNSSNSICYMRFNINGEHYGNCGFNWLPNITYIPCKQSDAMCGKLLCDTRSQQLAYYQNYLLLSSASIAGYTCNSVIFDFGLRIQDPGLVPNGASCGAGMMCISQKCVTIANLEKQSCDSQCLETEVCNNIGLCQSVVGPSKYEETTKGTNRGLIAGLCIFFIVIAPILVLAAIFGYKYRQQLKKCFSKTDSKKSDANANRELPTSVSQSVSTPKAPGHRTQGPSLSKALPTLSNLTRPVRPAPRPPVSSRPPISSAFCVERYSSSRNNDCDHDSAMTTEQNSINSQLDEKRQQIPNGSQKPEAPHNVVVGTKPTPPAKPSVFSISNPQLGIRPTPPPKPSTIVNNGAAPHV